MSNEFPFNDFSNVPYNKEEAEIASNVLDPNFFDRVIAARQQKEVELENAAIRGRESLSKHYNRYQDQQSTAGKFASLGTDSDVVRTVTGGALSGVGAVADGFGRIQDFMGGPNLSEPLKALGAKLQEAGEFARGSVSTETERSIDDSRITGDVFDPESWNFGEAPSAEGYAYQLLGVLGEFAPQAAGLLAKTPKAASGIMGLIGFMQAGSGQAQDAAEYLGSMDDETFFNNVELAQTLREANPNMTNDEIRQEVTRTAEATSMLIGGAVGGVGGAATGYILRPLQKSLPGNTLARGTASVGISGGEEGIQETLEPVLSRAATNAVIGDDRNTTEGTLEGAVLGTSFGGGLGAAGATVEAAQRAGEERREKREQRRADQQKKDLDLVTAIQEGQFETVVDKKNRDRFPLAETAQALGKVAMDAEASPEVRKQATDALSVLEAEALEGARKADKSATNLSVFEADKQDLLAELEEEKANLVKAQEAGQTPEQIATREGIIRDIEDELQEIDAQIAALKSGKGNETKNEVASITELRQNVLAAQAKDVDVEALVATAADTSTSPEARQASTRQLMTLAQTSPDLLTAEQMETLAKIEDTALNNGERQYLRELSKAKVTENLLKNMKTVGQDIFSDQPSRGYVSLPKYRSTITGAIARNDPRAAKRSLSMLNRFRQDHSAKAKQAERAFKAAQRTGKQYVIVSEDGQWKAKTKGKFWDEIKLKKNGGLSFSTGSGDLVNQIQTEAEAIEATYKALQQLVQGSSNAQESTNPTEPESEAPNPETGTGNGQTAPETVDGTSERTEGSTEPTGQRTERTGTDSDQSVESVPDSSTTEGSENPVETPTTRKLQGPVMRGRFPEAMTSEELENTTNKLTRKFGELQENIRRGAEVTSNEIDPIREDLNLLADVRLKNADPAIRELFDLLMAHEDGAAVEDVVAWAKKHGSKTHATILDKLMTHPDVQKLDTVTLLTEFEKDQNGVYKPFGMYFRDRNTLGFDPFALTDAQEVSFAVDIVTHELTHAATYNEIARNDAFRTEIQQISEEIGTWLQNEENRTSLSSQNLSALEYAINDPQELLATVFGAPSIMADLEKIPSERYGSAFNRFVTAVIDSVKALFNLNPTQANMLERVLLLGEAVMDAGKVPETRTDIGPVYSVFKEGTPKVDGQMTEAQLYTVNKVGAYFKNSGKTALSKEPDFVSNVLSRATADPQVLSGFVRGGQERVDQLLEKTSGRDYLKTVIDEITDMNKRIEKIFKPTETKFRWANPFSYFVNSDGSIDENIKTAISQAALDFAMSNHNDLWYNITDDQVRAFHGLAESTRITNEHRESAFEAGRRQQSVIQELGRKAYQASGLRLNRTAPVNEEQQIVMALGEVALGVLFDKEYFKRHTLETEDAASSFTVVSNKPDGNTKNPILEELRVTARGSQNFLDDLFGSEYVKVHPTLQPVKFQQKTIKNSPLALPKKLEKILSRENKKAHYLKDELVGRTGIFRRIPESVLERIAGVDEAGGRAIHKTKLIGLQGKNDAIRRELRILLEDTAEDLLGYDLSQPMYLDHFAAKMHRVFIKSNGFNPQNSKVHRYAFKMDGWDYQVDPTSNEGKNHREFKLAILDAFGKKTDDTTTENVLKRFDGLLEDPEILMAVDAINALRNDPELELEADWDATKVIEKVVLKHEENMHTFAGLIELGKYVEAKNNGTSFETSLIREGDGKTNGPIISLIQAGMPIDEETQTVLMNLGGLFMEGQEDQYRDYGDYADKVGMDLYKRLAKETTERMTELLNAKELKAEEYLPMRLLNHVIGNFIDDQGRVTGAGRTAVKQPLTSMIFGAGVSGTINAMADDFVDGIYQQFENILLKPNAETNMPGFITGLNQVMEIMAAKQKRPPSKQRYMIHPRVNTMEMEFNKTQRFLLQQTFKEFMGTSVRASLKSQFVDLLKARSTVNEAANMAFRHYNLAYQAERTKLLNLIAEETGNRYQDLTKEQEESITEKLKTMFPATHIAYSKASGEEAYQSGLPMLKEARETFDDNQYKVVTKFNNLKVIGSERNAIKEMSGYGVKKKYDEPGAGTMVLSAHGHDTAAAAETYARFNVLNSHDATHAPANLSAESIRQMNQSFFETMEANSIPENVMSALFRILDEFAAWEQDFVKDMEEETFADWEQSKVELRPMVWEDGIQVRSSKTTEQHAAEWLHLAAGVHRNRLSMLSRVTRVEQYYVDGAVYNVPENKREDLRKRAAEEDLVKLILEQRAKRQNRTAADLSREYQGHMAASVTPAPTTPNNRQASYRQGSPRQVTEFTTRQVLDALINREGVSPTVATRLQNVVDSVVNNLHGPFGAKKAAVEAKAGETAVDMAIRAEQEGVFPFSSRANTAGLGLSKAEMFVLEQAELAVRATLDGKSLADREVVKIYREAKKKLKPEDVYSGDKDKAKQIHDFIFRTDTDAGDSNSTHLSRFVALSLVYSPLHQALEKVIPQTETTSSEAFGDRLQNTFNDLVQKASDEINRTYQGQPANHKMEQLVKRLVQLEQSRKLAMAKEADGFTEQLEGATYGLRESVREAIVAASKSPLFRDSQWGTVRGGAALVEVFADDRVEEFLKALENFRNYTAPKKPLGLFMSTLNEIRGETTETQNFFKLLSRTGQIEQERKNFLEITKKEVLSRFENGDNLTRETKEAITQVFLRNDLSALYGTLTAEEITTLIRDESRLNQEIDKRTREILKDKSWGGYYMTEIKNLGYFLATGRNVSENLATNAYVLAHRYGVGDTGSQVPDSLVETIDELTTLYALKYTPPATKAALSGFIEVESRRNNESGINYLLQYHKGLKKDAMAELFDNNPVQMLKGYTREIYNPHTEVVAASGKEGKELEAKGYVPKYELPQDRADPDFGKKKTLYVLKDAGLRDYVTGALSNTGMRARGSLINANSSITTPEAVMQWKKDRIEQASESKFRKINFAAYYKDYRADYDPRKKAHGKLAPVYAPDGSITNYRYLMDHDTKDELLDRDSSIENVLGGMVASQYDKVNSPAQNKAVVTALYDFYQGDYVRNPNAYVEVSLESPEPELREAYRLLSERTKQDIKEVWGMDKMFIRNDLLDLVLGYRKQSLSDMFGIDENERNVLENFLVNFIEQFWGKEAAVKVRRAEDMWQATVKIVKDIWVIRNLTTLLGNVMSNTTLLLAYGVPPKKIIEGHREAIEGLLKYQETRNQLMKREMDLRTGVGDPDTVAEQIRELRFDLERSPVHELVEEGMFQTIMEDIDAERDDYQYKDKLNRTLDDWAGKLPKPARKVGEVLTVAHNTTLYKLLFKGTQMSDFVGRYVLYNHLSSRKVNPLSRTEVLKRVREAFVNYDVPTHRSLQYANDMGLVFFTKYYLRIQKVIFGLMQEHPARALGVVLASNYLGGIANIFDSNALGRIGDNPFDVGALNIVDAADEPIPLKMLFGLLD